MTVRPSRICWTERWGSWKDQLMGLVCNGCVFVSPDCRSLTRSMGRRSCHKSDVKTNASKLACENIVLEIEYGNRTELLVMFHPARPAQSAMLIFIKPSVSSSGPCDLRLTSICPSFSSRSTHNVRARAGYRQRKGRRSLKWKTIVRFLVVDLLCKCCGMPG